MATLVYRRRLSEYSILRARIRPSKPNNASSRPSSLVPRLIIFLKIIGESTTPSYRKSRQLKRPLSFMSAHKFPVSSVADDGPAGCRPFVRPVIVWRGYRCCMCWRKAHTDAAEGLPAVSPGQRRLSWRAKYRLPPSVFLRVILIDLMCCLTALSLLWLASSCIPQLCSSSPPSQ